MPAPIEEATDMFCAHVVIPLLFVSDACSSSSLTAQRHLTTDDGHSPQKGALVTYAGQYCCGA